MDKNLILRLKKLNEMKTMNSNTNLDMNPILDKNMNSIIYIYNNQSLCDIINKFSNFYCTIFTDNIKINKNDFIIYPEQIEDNPLGFKNVIRIIQSKSFSLYSSSDILLFYSETESLINQLTLNLVLHPMLIDYYTNEFHNKEFHITKLDEINIRKIDDLINRKIYLQNITFTDPIINLFNKNGLQSNTLNTLIILDNISIEVEFKITSYDNQSILS